LDENVIEKIRSKEAFICDMDGVIYHGNRLLPGVKEFVKWLQTANKKFLFLTNERICKMAADGKQKIFIPYQLQRTVPERITGETPKAGD